MSTLPLHPAVVHLPLALALLSPFVAAAAAWFTLRSGARAPWLALVATLGVALGGGFAAMNTGESDEERVERVVAESLIEEHEEAAKVFMASLGLALVLAIGGTFMPGAARKGLVFATIVATIGAAGLGLRTGHQGGELVYTHGAAAAHVAPGKVPPATRAHDDD